MTPMMTSVQVVETSVTVTDDSSSQDYSHPDGQTTRSTVTPDSNHLLQNEAKCGGGGGVQAGCTGDMNLPLPALSPPAATPSLVAHASLVYFYCKTLRNIAKYFAILSRFPPACESLSPLSLLPPPVLLRSAILPGSRPPAPLHD